MNSVRGVFEKELYRHTTHYGKAGRPKPFPSGAPLSHLARLHCALRLARNGARYLRQSALALAARQARGA